MKVLAKSRNLHISAQKLRLSTEDLRGKSVQVALQQLASRPQKSAVYVFDTIKSAAANAEHNNNATRSSLFIDEIRVDQATKLKRWRPRSRGMTAPIEHPRAHLMVVVSDQPVVAAQSKKPTKVIKKTAVTAKAKPKAAEGNA